MALLDFAKKKRDQVVGFLKENPTPASFVQKKVTEYFKPTGEVRTRDIVREYPGAVKQSLSSPLKTFASTPKATFADDYSWKENPIKKFAATVPQEIINTPVRAARNIGQTGLDIQDMVRRKQLDKRKALQIAGRTGEQVLDALSMGKGKAVLATGNQFLKGVKPLGQLMKEGGTQGLKTGMGYGAGYGASQGVQDENATVKSVAQNTAVGTLAGGVLGGALGGGLPALGALPGSVRNSIKNRLNKPQVTDTIPAHYVSNGRKPVAVREGERPLFPQLPANERFSSGVKKTGFDEVVQSPTYSAKTEKLIPTQQKTNRAVPTISDWSREVRGALPAPGMSIKAVDNPLPGKIEEIVKAEADAMIDMQKSAEGPVMLNTGYDYLPGSGEFHRISDNPQWYRDFYKRNGRAPGKKEILAIAKENLENGRGYLQDEFERAKNPTPDDVNESLLSFGRRQQTKAEVFQQPPRIFKNREYPQAEPIPGSIVAPSRTLPAGPAQLMLPPGPTPTMRPTQAKQFTAKYGQAPEVKTEIKSTRPMYVGESGQASFSRNKAGAQSTKPPISNRPYEEVNPFQEYSAQGQKTSPIGTKLRTIFQDRMASQKKLQQQPGIKVEEGANPYQAEELFHGRTGSRVEQATKEVEMTLRGMADYAKESGIEFKQLRGAVNRYLQSKHTAERNALHGDGAAGLTNRQADEILETIESSEHGTAVAKFASELGNINTKTLDILQESGILSKAQVDTMRTAYKNHVPLQRIMDEGDDVLGVLGGGKGYDVKSSGVKKAIGSEREVNDIAGNILANYEQAIIRAEKNRYGKNVLKFAQNNKETGLFEISKKGTPDNNTLVVFSNGEKVNVKIKDDQLAATLRGVDIERIPELLRPVAAVTRFFSSMATRYNPEFVLSNIVRDSQELAVYIASQSDMPKGSVGAVTKMIPGSANDVRKALSGDFSSEGSKLYQQMVADGGTTGGLGLSTRKQVQLDISKLEKLVQSKPRQAAHYLAEGIDNWNQIFEDATRLSAYKQAISSGLSRARAASIAKNSTVNFNRKGTSGPVINALYMFANASIQGTAKMFIAMKNPKVAAVTVAAVAAPVFAINKWNDDVDPEWRDKVADWDRQSNLVVMLPSDEGAKYFTIPVSWGLKPIKVIADQSYDIATGNSGSKSEIAGKIVTAFTESYNPIGGTDLVSAAVPTVLDTPVDIARNQKWSGSMIRSDKELVSNHENYFGSLNNSPLGQAAIGATAKVAEMTGNKIDINPANLTYAIQQLIGGAGRSAERFLTTATVPVRDGELEAKDVPFVNRFYKTVPDEQIEKNQKYKDKDSFEKSLKKLKNGSEEQKAYIQEYLWTKPKEDRGGIMYGLQLKGVMTKGLTTKDEPDAVIDREKENFEESGENFRDKGDYILRKDANGAVRKESRLLYDTAVSEQKRSDLKKKKDIEGWKKEATTLYRLYMKQLEEPSIDELEKMKIQAKIDTLVTDNAKYKSYGGFTKPKKAKKINIPSANDADYIVKNMSSRLRPLRAFGRSRTNLASVARPKITRHKLI